MSLNRYTSLHRDKIGTDTNSLSSLNKRPESLRETRPESWVHAKGWCNGYVHLLARPSAGSKRSSLRGVYPALRSARHIGSTKA